MSVLLVLLLVAVVVGAILLLSSTPSAEASSNPEAENDSAPAPTEPYSRVGCFAEGSPRVLENWLGDFGKATGDSWSYDKCYLAAKAKGYKYFGRQYNYQCFAGNGDYARVGPSENCNYLGKNGSGANEVYRINY